MPSPFPGMDPYLENPGLWPDVHTELISGMRATLNQLVRPRYYVRIEERVYISDESDVGREVIIPDLKIREHQEQTRETHQQTTTAQAEVAEPMIATTLIDDEIHEAYLKVLDSETRSVVTVIELLSPTNKYPGSEGMRSYRKKRHEIMQSGSHLVEIDLLREGARIATAEPLPVCDYLIHASRVEELPLGRLWPVRLREQLPSIPIPLRAGDDDVPLDLRQVLNTAYDRAAYDLEIDYRREPVPPLDAELAAWSDQLLKERGLR